MEVARSVICVSVCWAKMAEHIDMLCSVDTCGPGEDDSRWVQVTHQKRHYSEGGGSVGPL